MMHRVSRRLLSSGSRGGMLEPFLRIEEELLAAASRQAKNEEEELDVIDGNESGTVVDVKDGFAVCTGFKRAGLNDVVRLPSRKKDQGQLLGHILCEEEKTVRIGVFGDIGKVSVGEKAQVAVDRQLAVPHAKPRQVLNALGEKFMEDQEDVELSTKKLQIGDHIVNAVLDRNQVREQLFTGVLPIDTLFPIGLGHRVGICGNNLVALQNVVIDMVSEILTRDQIDSVVWVKVGQDKPSIMKTVAELDAKKVLDRTSVICSPNTDSWGLQALAPVMACAIADEKASRGQNVLMIIDNLNCIGAAVARAENARHLIPSSSRPLSRWSQVHRYLDNLGNYSEAAGNGSVTALCLMATDGSVASDQEVDALSSQVDFITHFTGYQVKTIGAQQFNNPAQEKAFSKLASMVRQSIYEAARVEANGVVARELGLDPAHETELNQGLVKAANLRAIFERDLRRPITRQPYELLIVLHTVASGVFEDEFPKDKIAEFFNELFEEAKVHNLEKHLQDLSSNDELSSEVANTLKAITEPIYRRFNPQK